MCSTWVRRPQVCRQVCRCSLYVQHVAASHAEEAAARIVSNRQAIVKDALARKVGSAEPGPGSRDTQEADVFSQGPPF